MRPVLTVVAGAAAILAVDVQLAQAQFSNSRNPWCIRDGSAGRGTWNCSFRTQQQCLDTARGSGGGCVRNPNYQPGSKSKQQRRQR